MKSIKALESLDNSWSRKEVLIKLQNGMEQDKIINQFIYDNKEDIEKLNSCLQPNDKEALKHMEELSTCEAKLINKITNLNINKDIYQSQEKLNKQISTSNQYSIKRFELFMLKWSNKFVVITLITISVIALSKQAWA